MDFAYCKLEIFIPETNVEVTVRAERVDEPIAAVHPYEEPVMNAIPLWRTSF